MYGAFIGDIVGSKYEFNNIKTKRFPLFSEGCDYTDDTIMTAAVAKAIMLSRREQNEKNGNGKGFQEFLIEAMQDFGEKYPTPTGAYGGMFAKWLRQQNPKPYNSYGNGSAMRVSPCGLAAVSMDEALALARTSACITHDHPEGVKGAEAVSAAIFLAKCGKSKTEIKQYVSEHYYNLDFTLDSIRDSYKFDGSCQGSVPQAIAAFLESENFEDAIRNVISIGGDCDTTGAITGSIAWIYYAGYGNWAANRYDAPMQNIKSSAMKYLPKEFIDIAEEFWDMCVKRAGTYYRGGFCTPILNRSEMEKYGTDRGKPFVRQNHVSSFSDTTETEIKKVVTEFCKKYVVLMEVLYRDKELNQWCHNYSAYSRNTEHCALEKVIYDGFMHEAYTLGFMPKVLSRKSYATYQLERMLAGTDEDLIYGICMEIRGDYGNNGSLITHAIADGNLYRLMSAYLKTAQTPQYTLEYIAAQEGRSGEENPGAWHVWHDRSMEKWRLRIQLDADRLWYLSVFIRDDGSFEKYSLDEEAAKDSHYEFVEEQKIRKCLYIPGDENRYFHEILLRHVQSHGGASLLTQIMPYVTEQFHF